MCGFYEFNGQFCGCTGLTGTPDLSNITSVGNGGLRQTFYGCTGLTGDIYFSSLDPLLRITTSPFTHTFYRCTGIDSVHFPASFSLVQQAILSKQVLFGGDTAPFCKPTLQILFDL